MDIGTVQYAPLLQPFKILKARIEFPAVNQTSFRPCAYHCLCVFAGVALTRAMCIDCIDTLSTRSATVFEWMPRDAAPASPEGSVFATLAFYCISGFGTLSCQEAAQPSLQWLLMLENDRSIQKPNKLKERFLHKSVQRSLSLRHCPNPSRCIPRPG